MGRFGGKPPTDRKPLGTLRFGEVQRIVPLVSTDRARESRAPMPSRFQPNRSGRGRTMNHLKKRRAYFALQMPLRCWRCGTLITDDVWDLGHRIDLAHGGNEFDVWPEHRYPIPGVCVGNRSGGSQVRASNVRASRDW